MLTFHNMKTRGIKEEKDIFFGETHNRAVRACLIATRLRGCGEILLRIVACLEKYSVRISFHTHSDTLKKKTII